MKMVREDSYVQNPSENAESIYKLFRRRSKYLTRNLYPKRFPVTPPEPYGKRHRHPNFKRLNIFRHWWKSSRLLVRLSGALVYAFVIVEWNTIFSSLIQHEKKSLKAAMKTMTMIGRGGMNRWFLKGVQPGTRTLRIVMAVGRGLEASVDNRFWEVLISEGFAFMGNRGSRWWARKSVDWISHYIIFPGVLELIPSQYYENTLTAVIFIMGIVRAVLPFISSFIGSRIGRGTTLAASERMNYRWKSVQNVNDFVVSAGTKRSTGEDIMLVRLAQKVAKAIGNGADPLAARNALHELGFESVGAGVGGYALYRNFHHSNNVVHLHVTPFGPSLLGEMPRYIILERRHIGHYGRNHSFFSSINHAPEFAVTGITYSGSYFSPQEWASLKSRYVKELSRYDIACKYMGSKSNSVWALNNFLPPTDRATLKAFLRSGSTPKSIRKDNRRWEQVMKGLDHISMKLKYFDKQGKAPKGVIVYMEGLDCAGKSSTGGLIVKALEAAGYNIHIVQYNRPPTAEDLEHPWMWRFKQPTVAVDDKITKNALVWDRGPAGDFVYGDMRKLSPQEKMDHYIEFHKFEEECLDKGIMFLKLFYIADRDSISKTLGKRLAQKKIGRDLQIWLDANSVLHDRVGLEEIEQHIDPTDFIALNRYDQNLHNFYDFVLNTDHVGRLHHTAHRNWCAYNPWVVVSTHDRHLARLSIMKTFEKQLEQYVLNYKHHDDPLVTEYLDEKEYEEKALEVWADEETPLYMSARPTSYHDRCKENRGNVYTAIRESAWHVLVLIVIFYTYFHCEKKVEFWGDEDSD